MTPEKTAAAFAECERLLLSLRGSIEPRRIDPGAIADDEMEAAAHLLWLCREGAQLARAGREQKAGRWLGFVQGALWFGGHACVGELKNMNRPDDRPGPPRCTACRDELGPEDEDDERGRCAGCALAALENDPNYCGECNASPCACEADR